jgi:hypothetical protein
LHVWHGRKDIEIRKQFERKEGRKYDINDGHGKISYEKRKISKGKLKLHNEELHNFCSSPNIIRIIKSRRVRWTEYVAQMWRRGMHVGY